VSQGYAGRDEATAGYKIISTTSRRVMDAPLLSPLSRLAQTCRRRQWLISSDLQGFGRRYRRRTRLSQMRLARRSESQVRPGGHVRAVRALPALSRCTTVVTRDSFMAAIGTPATIKEGQSQFGFAPVVQTSTCSAMARASSTSMPRYLTVLSIFVCPKSSCTARKLPVRR